MHLLTMTRLFAMVSRRLRSVPSTVGVWKTVRERANIASTSVSSASRRPQFSIIGSASSQWA